MDRKSFLKQLAIGGFVVSNPSVLSAMTHYSDARVANKLTILHTNDTHARIEPFPASSGKYAGLGGVSRRAAMIEAERTLDPELLLLDAGDIFQGTPYFNFFGGELDLKLMSAMGYDATTIGNHEFDNGLEGFAEVAKYADFPFLSANYDVRATIWKEWIQPYTILDRKGLRIGIFGLGIDLDGLVLPKLYGDVKYRDPVLHAQAMARTLKQYKKCNLLICLSHLGYDYNDPNRISDVKLAQKVPGIDLILGGHTHTFLDKPFMHHHTNGSKTYVHQVGFAGIRLGRVDVYFDDAGQALAMSTTHKTVSLT